MRWIRTKYDACGPGRKPPRLARMTTQYREFAHWAWVATMMIKTTRAV